MPLLLHYAEMTDTELTLLEKETAFVILPISLLEAHGPHLPLGTDFLIAGTLAKALGEKILARQIKEQVVLLPTVPLGAGGITRPGTLNHSEKIIQQTIVEFGEKLKSYGFEQGLIISGHAGQGHLKAMSAATRELKHKYGFEFLPLTSYLFLDAGMKKIGAALKKQRDKDLALSIPPYDGHAGCWETSLALYFFPELVRESYKVLPHSDDADANGYRGNPSQANVALGKRLSEFLIEIAMQIIEAHIGG